MLQPDGSIAIAWHADGYEAILVRARFRPPRELEGFARGVADVALLERSLPDLRVALRRRFPGAFDLHTLEPAGGPVAGRRDVPSAASGAEPRPGVTLAARARRGRPRAALHSADDARDPRRERRLRAHRGATCAPTASSTDGGAAAAGRCADLFLGYGLSATLAPDRGRRTAGAGRPAPRRVPHPRRRRAAGRRAAASRSAPWADDLGCRRAMRAPSRAPATRSPLARSTRSTSSSTCRHRSRATRTGSSARSRTSTRSSIARSTATAGASCRHRRSSSCRGADAHPDDADQGHAAARRRRGAPRRRPRTPPST